MSAPYYTDDSITLHHGDAAAVLAELEAGSVDCCVTSPPYFGLRDYGVDGQIGAESSPAEFVAALVAVFEQVRRVLADDGTCWVNLGDSYVSKPPGNVRGVSDRSGLNGAQTSERYRETLVSGMGTKRDTTGMGVREKNLLGMPWRLAFALQDAGWYLRNAIVWNKPNAMPESVTDRLSTRYELIFLLTKSRRYWFDLDPIREEHVSAPGREGANCLRGQKAMRPVGPNSGAYSIGGRNPGDVWEIATQPYPGAHFAVFPPEIPRRAILAGCKPGGTVLDPFHGSGTTGMVAEKLGRKYVGIDLSAEYLALSLRTRLSYAALPFEDDRPTMEGGR
jgi:DNA modification methylase